MKHVAILTDRLLDRGSGTERYVMELIQALLQSHHRVSVHTTKVAVTKTMLADPQLNVVCYALPYCPRKLRFPFFLRFLQRSFRPQDFDMVIGINTPYSPHISICCGTYLGSMLANHYELLKPLNWLRVHFEKKKYRGCQWVMPRSLMQKQELTRLFQVPENRIRVAPPPVMPAFKPKDEHSRSLYRDKYRLSERRWNFLFPSTGHHRKGLGLIIKAFSELANPQCRIVVAGSRLGFYRSPYLHYVGYVEAMEELYHACDASLLLSNYEPFGRAVAESLLCATPVFISDRVGAQSLLLEAGMGWVLPLEQPEKLAAALARFIAEPPPFPYHCIQLLRQQLSWERHLKLLSSLPKDTPTNSSPDLSADEK